MRVDYLDYSKSGKDYAPDAPGIYVWSDMETGMEYVGRSNRLCDRLDSYLSYMRKGQDGENRWFTSELSQRPWAFEFRIVELCDVYVLPDREKYWIRTLGTKGTGYNQLI